MLLWEVFSYGRAPYPKMVSSTLGRGSTCIPCHWLPPPMLHPLCLQSLKEVSEAVEKGYRMEPPDGCPGPVHTLMGSCWEAEPARRPPFRKIVEKLGRELRSVGVTGPAVGQEAEGSAPTGSQDR